MPRWRAHDRSADNALPDSGANNVVARHPASIGMHHLLRCRRPLALDLFHAPGREDPQLRRHDAALVHDVVVEGMLQVRPSRVCPDGIRKAAEGDRALFLLPRVRAREAKTPASQRQSAGRWQPELWMSCLAADITRIPIQGRCLLPGPALPGIQEGRACK